MKMTNRGTQTRQASSRLTFLTVLLIANALHSSGAESDRALSGKVVDTHGAAVPGAVLLLSSPSGGIAGNSSTNAAGEFTVKAVAPGSYVLRVSAEAFEDRILRVMIRDNVSSTPLVVEMELTPVRSEVTVTASRGSVDDASSTTQFVAVRDRADIEQNAGPTLGNVLEDSPGIMVQQTTLAQVSPVLRGLTGYHVLNLVDGVRFNNAIFRSGPNQYLAFILSSQAESIDAALGPSSSQYGSDSLGGVIQVATPPVRFSSSERPQVHGQASFLGATADLSGQANGRLSIGSRRWGMLFGGTGRRFNDLRSGHGEDSRNVFVRYFGLSAAQTRGLIGPRLQDSGFSHYGLETKFSVRPADDQSLTLWYQQGRQEDARQYRNLLGGRGFLQSRFEPQRLDLFYTRYEILGAGPFDAVVGRFSINSQSDGNVQQRLNFTDQVQTEENGVRVYGYSIQAVAGQGANSVLLMGADVYNEHIAARRFATTPLDGVTTEVRPLYPDGSRYTSYAVFAEESAELLDGRLRAVAGGRYTSVRVRTFADSFGVIDSSQSFHDMTFTASLAWRARRNLQVHARVSRGFRAPNMNDLGALGLNSLGFEVPAAAAVPAGALLGSSDGEDAVSLGPLRRLRAESLWNMEAGLTVRTDRFYGRFQAFNAELYDPIVRRTLLFPAASPPTELSGIPVKPLPRTAEQQVQEVTAVATSLDPLSVKAFVNDGRARYYGFESLFRVDLASRWALEGSYSFLAGRELNPNRYVRRLPPQRGFVSLRHLPRGGRLWWRLNAHLVGAQRRLSGGDLTDERIGAARSRRDIADLFHGAVLSPFVRPGADGRRGGADDVFAPTGESLGTLLDRVLPIGAAVNGVMIENDRIRAPLYIHSPGWVSLEATAGLALTERVDLFFGASNLLDHNYRSHGSGIDGPGFSGVGGISYSF